MGNLADAYVSVMPDTRGFGPQLDKDLSKVNAKPAGTKIGHDVGEGARLSMGSKFEEIGRDVIAPLMGLFAIDKAREFFTEAISGASTTAEQQSKVGIVFGKSAEEIYAASEKSAASMGISEKAYLTSAGTLGNLFTALKITPAKAAELSTKMISLGSDMAAFNKSSPEITLKAIQSGIVGQYKPLRKFGVAIDAAAVKSEALKLGLVHATGATDKIQAAQIHATIAQNAYTAAVKAHGPQSQQAQTAAMHLSLANIQVGKAMKGTVPALTAQQKALASVALIQEMAGKAQGNFKLTSHNLAEQQMILAAEFDDLKDKIGKAFLPVMLTLVHIGTSMLMPALLAIAKAIQDWVTPISKSKVAISLLGGALVTIIILLKTHVLSLKLAELGMAGYAKETTIGKLATEAFEAAQWALKAAMSTTPLGLATKALILLGAGFVLAYKNSATFRSFVQAAWAGIKAATAAAWAGIVVVFTAMRNWITKTLMPVVSAFWHTTVAPAMAGIGHAIATMWNGVVRPAFTAISGFVRNTLGPAVLWWWHNVSLPAFSAIGTAIRVWWSIAHPILQLTYDIIRKTVGPTISWLWHNVVVPAFSGIATAIRVWWSIARPIMQLFYDIIRKTVGPAVSWLWHSVVAPVFSGIGHVISSVWNATIHPVLNALGSAVASMLPGKFKTGVGAISTAWNALKAVAKAPVNFLIGTVYDQGIRGLFNKVASVVGSSARLPYFPQLHDGGPVPYLPGSDPRKDSVVALVQPGEFVVRQDGSNLTDAMAFHGIPGFIGGGVVPGTGGSVKKTLGNIGSAIKGAVGGAAGAVKGAVSSAGGWVLGMLEKAAGGVLGNIRGLIGQIGTSPLAGLLKSGASQLVSGLLSFIKGQDKKATAGGQYTGPIPGGGAVTRWSSTVLAALKALHQSPSWLATVLRRMNQESGGNPNAQNNTDINAQNGVPSQGLMQVIPPTFAAYAGPYRGLGIRNPLANIYAGLNYAIHRYGSLSALNRPGGYANGGMLNPGQLGFNETRRPERVLSARQTEAFERLVDMLDGGAGLHGPRVSVTNHYPQAEPTSVTVNRALAYTAALGR